MAPSILFWQLERESDLKRVPSVLAFRFVAKLSFLESVLIEHHSPFPGSRTEELSEVSSPHTHGCPRVPFLTPFASVLLSAPVGLFASLPLFQGTMIIAALFPKSPCSREKAVEDPPSLRSEHSPAAACGFVSHGLGQVVLYLLIVHVTKR